MASRKAVRAAAAQPSPVTTPQARPATAAFAPDPLKLAIRRAMAASFAVAAVWSPLAQVQAQAADAQADAATAAQAHAVRQYNIPAGSLSEVLTRFSTESGVFLGGATDLAEGKSSPGLRGRYTVEQALRTLLAGSGLSYRFAGENRVTLVAAQEGDGPLRTGPILVAGDAASGAGPVEGFRAETSSSATNVDAPLIETPATVNVLTGEFIDTIGARRIEDALQYIPGVSADFSNANATAFNIRGFSSAVFDASATQGGDAIRIDGFRSFARRYHYDSALYERTDILKGGSSLLYGTAAPGGLVQFVTKKPEFEQRTRIEGTLGSFDTSRFMLDSTGPSTDGGDLAYRLIVVGQDSNQVFHGGNNDRSFDKRLIVNPQITWLAPGGGTLRASYEYSQYDNVLDPGILRLTDGSFTFNTDPFLGPDSFQDRENHIGILEFTQPLGEDWEVSLAGALGRTDFDALWDFSAGAPDENDQFFRFTRRFNEEFDSEEFRAEIKGDFHTGDWVRHQFTLGASYLSAESIRNQSPFVFSGGIDGRNPVFGSAPATGPVLFNFGQTIDETALYVQNFVSLGEEITVFGGLRYTDAEAVTLRVNGDRIGKDKALDYTLGAIYNYNAWINPFISYSTSLTPQTGALSGSGDPVPFREGEQVEIGLKSEWFDRRLATTLSIFEIEQTNISEGDAANPGFFILVGDQRTRGFEFEAVGKITDQVNILGGYSFLDAEFTESTTGNKGNTPHSVPQHKFSIFGEYAFSGGLERRVGFHPCRRAAGQQRQ